MPEITPPLPKQPTSRVRLFMKNGSSFLIEFVAVQVGLDGFNNYMGQNGIALCSVQRSEVAAFVNVDIPVEMKPGEKPGDAPIRTFPDGYVASSGYVF